MEDVTQPGPRSIGRDETVELVCTSGHRTTHLLARILRLNDGWCGKCGADLHYEPREGVEPSLRIPGRRTI